MNKSTIQFFKPIIGLFVVVTLLIFIFSNWLDKNDVNHSVLLYANFILLALVAVTGFLHIKASVNNNPHAFVRSITLSAFIKLIVIAIAVLVYFTTAGENTSVYAVGAAMMLYLIYTVLEVRGAMHLNRKKNAKS